MSKRKDINWDAIAQHYRAGIRSLRDIGLEFGITEGAIRRKAKVEDWPRDLSRLIKEKAADKIRKEFVRNCTIGASEREIVESNAQLQADIQILHRLDIPKKRALVSKLFREIEEQTDGKDLIEQLTLALSQGDMEQLAKQANKMISLPVRIKGAAELVAAYKHLISLERQAFGIDENKSFGADDVDHIEINFVKANG